MNHFHGFSDQHSEGVPKQFSSPGFVTLESLLFNGLVSNALKLRAVTKRSKQNFQANICFYPNAAVWSDVRLFFGCC